MNNEWIHEYLNNTSLNETPESTKTIMMKMCNTILRMENYIYNLENKIEKMTHNHLSEKRMKQSIPNYIPTHSISEWIKYCPINNNHMDSIFKNTILEGFKQYIQYCMDYSSTMLIPLSLVDGKPQKLYGFHSVMEDSDSELESSEVDVSDIHLSEKTGSLFKWQPMVEKHIHLFIEDIWRKMLEFYYTNPKDLNEDETQTDLNKKKLLSMRKILVEKHKKEIERFLIKQLKQKI